MSAMVDLLVERQHAEIDARPRFAAQVVRTTVKARDARLIPMWNAAYCVRPNLAWATGSDIPHSAVWYEAQTREEAELVAKTMLFCGAATVSIHSYNNTHTAEAVEHWQAVS